MTPKKIKQNRPLHERTAERKLTNEAAKNIGPGYLVFQSKLSDDKIEELKKAMEMGYQGGSNPQPFRVESIESSLVSIVPNHKHILFWKHLGILKRRRKTVFGIKRRKISTFYKLRRAA